MYQNPPAYFARDLCFQHDPVDCINNVVCIDGHMFEDGPDYDVTYGSWFAGAYLAWGEITKISWSSERIGWTSAGATVEIYPNYSCGGFP